MKIKRVEVSNVKCYSEAQFDFENGINFISGINGAGKTSIIESIGFALFDYKIGKNGFNTYFIKRGEKKASVRVVFEDKDSQEYIVDRKISFASNNSWVIKDCETEEEIVSGEIDVLNWLKDHLGFYRDDNISQIYENIISVPQGMFTSAFLDTAQNRKNKFDPIFNLEVYRTVFKNTASLESGLKSKKIYKEAELGKLDVRIEMLSKDKDEHTQLEKELDSVRKIKQEKDDEFKNVNEKYKAKSKIKNEITNFEENIKIDNIKQENVNRHIETLSKNLEMSSNAKKLLDENKQGYDIYKQEEEKQKVLKNKKKEYDKLIEKRNSLNTDVDKSKTVINLKDGNKEKIKNTNEIIKNEIKELDKLIQEDEKKLNENLLKLEQEKRDVEDLKEKELRAEQERMLIIKSDSVIQSYNDNINRLDKLVQREKELLNLKAELENQIKEKANIEKEKNDVEENLSKLIAKLENLNESKKISKTGICPYLKPECINVKGKTVEEYDSEIENVKTEIQQIKQRKLDIVEKERKIVKAEAEIQNMSDKIKEINDAKNEIEKIKIEIAKDKEKNEKSQKVIYDILESNKIEKDLKNIDELKKLSQERQKEFNKNDKEYNVMKTKLENVKKDRDKKHTEIEKNNEEISKTELEIKNETEEINKRQEEISEIDKQLKEYGSLEVEIEQNEEILKKTKISYDVYIQNKEMAGKVDEIKTQLDISTKEIQEIQDSIKKEMASIENLEKEYDEEEFKKLEKSISELTTILVEKNAQIKSINERLEVLKKNIEELKRAKEEVEKIKKNIETYQKAIEYLVKIRQIIKQAPEDISEILIQKVSKKATEIYSQIANDNTRLEWREGYEVILIDSIDGKQIEKEFRQLSGGEQMSAALAIRISMLEILTNIKIGILDEPTVNMDIGRRQRLAEIIESIGSFFIQLFIVSHDDTFNSITENTIQL